MSWHMNIFMSQIIFMKLYRILEESCFYNLLYRTTNRECPQPVSAFYIVTHDVQ